MIDIVKVLREQHPDLGPYVIALRPASGLIAPDDSGALAEEVRDWARAEAPSAVLSLRPVTYAPFPGWPEETRTLEVVSFADAAELARFATRWTH
ncbi:hypothetical protein [Methylobacterium isbiliense]|jgi:hypothetical protein|uniref:Uncharacterized protein n=1 Tax=Methylobacterium isbiliense TaxID=315478 RepID=A0ABQ4SA49_9HYPH|nr:hypothetical protein [Methylobacterium isbiliense]MDN3622176.1 hypothetical protein [Methylobacterium isbiliense]GJD98535.1 hypothetical protein GMJLKIPL_0446 [Methylobacterium isbiliense]